MNSATTSSAISPAMTLLRTESEPSVASTVRSSTMLIGTGTAPAFIWIANVRASLSRRPVMTPLVVMTACTVGEEIDWLSRKIPSGLPIRRLVICPKRLDALVVELKRNLRLVRALVEHDLGVRAEVFPGELLLGAVEAGGGGDLPLSGGGVHLAEVKLRGLADQLLRFLDVLHAWQLDDDPVGALRLNDRLGHAVRVDAPIEHLDHAFENLVRILTRRLGHIGQQHKMGAALKVKSLGEPLALEMEIAQLDDEAARPRPEYEDRDDGDDGGDK